MTYARKTDDNHKEIVKLFRQLGAAVADTSACGNGFPDLVVQFIPRNRATFGLVTCLVEIKNSDMPPSKQALTPAQVKFHQQFQCYIVKSEADVCRLMGIGDEHKWDKLHD